MVKERIKRMLNLESLLRNVEGLVETRIARYRVEIQQEIAFRVRKALMWGGVMILSIIVLLLFSVAAGFWLGTHWDSYALGFLVVGSFYLLITIALILYLQNRFPKHNPNIDTDEHAEAHKSNE